jgi:dolichol-phosphate mannosyltransferase
VPQLSVIIPTLNEAANVPLLVERLETALAGIDWEVIFVDDDSGDGTANRARSLAQSKPYVRVLQRIGRKGLSSACIEGMMASVAPYLAVMDGDLQHDETILPRMLERLRREGLDLVVGSRNVQGGGMGEFSAGRQALSQWGRRVSQIVCRCSIGDPMSGFFLLDRRFLDETVRRMSGVSFKILVDLLASSPRPVRFAEEPYTFRSRIHGTSKLDTAALLEYAYLIADKLIGGYVPTRFLLFVAAGLLGLILHLSVLGVLLHYCGVEFLTAQAVATLIAMTANFLGNNSLAFRDRRLKGWRILGGLLAFYAACSVGAITNLGLAEFLYQRGLAWFLAGLAGTIVGSVWNYGVTSVFIWRLHR